MDKTVMTGYSMMLVFIGIASIPAIVCILKDAIDEIKEFWEEP